MIVRLSGPIEVLVNTCFNRIGPDENGLARIESPLGPIISIKFTHAPHLTEVLEWGDFRPITCESMFEYCKNLTAIPKEAPDLSQCRSTKCMFNEAYSFNQEIGHWDMSSVQNMELMFLNAASFNQNLDGWDTRSVVRLEDIFIGSGMQAIPKWCDLINKTQLKIHRDIIHFFVEALQDYSVDVDYVSVGQGGLIAIKNDTRAYLVHKSIGTTAISQEITVPVKEWSFLCEKIDEFLKSGEPETQDYASNFVLTYLNHIGPSKSNFYDFYVGNERDSRAPIEAVAGTIWVETRKKL
jgi:hypothetical protein